MRFPSTLFWFASPSTSRQLTSATTSTPFTRNLHSTNAAVKMSVALFDTDPLWVSSWKEGLGEKTLRKHMDKTENAAGRLDIYGAWYCPFAQRAWIAAEESRMNYRWIEITPCEIDEKRPGGYTLKSLPLEEKRARYPEFIRASPRGAVPAITTIDGQDLWESMPVSEYIDAEFNSGKLTFLANGDAAPAMATPLNRAKLQIWTAHSTDHIAMNFYRSFMAKTAEAYTTNLEKLIIESRTIGRAMLENDAINEKTGGGSVGPYFLGSEFSIVDVALMPFWQRITVLGGRYMGLNLPKDEPEFVRLEKWWAAVQERPSVKNTIVSPDRLISCYLDYYGGGAKLAGVVDE